MAMMMMMMLGAGVAFGRDKGSKGSKAGGASAAASLWGRVGHVWVA